MTAELLSLALTWIQVGPGSLSPDTVIGSGRFDGAASGKVSQQRLSPEPLWLLGGGAGGVGSNHHGDVRPVFARAESGHPGVPWQVTWVIPRSPSWPRGLPGPRGAFLAACVRLFGPFQQHDRTLRSPSHGAAVSTERPGGARSRAPEAGKFGRPLGPACRPSVFAGDREACPRASPAGPGAVMVAAGVRGRGEAGWSLGATPVTWVSGGHLDSPRNA